MFSWAPTENETFLLSIQFDIYSVWREYTTLAFLIQCVDGDDQGPAIVSNAVKENLCKESYFGCQRAISRDLRNPIYSRSFCLLFHSQRLPFSTDSPIRERICIMCANNFAADSYRADITPMPTENKNGLRFILMQPEIDRIHIFDFRSRHNLILYINEWLSLDWRKMENGAETLRKSKGFYIRWNSAGEY